MVGDCITHLDDLDANDQNDGAQNDSLHIHLSIFTYPPQEQCRPKAVGSVFRGHGVFTLRLGLEMKTRDSEAALARRHAFLFHTFPIPHNITPAALSTASARGTSGGDTMADISCRSVP